MAATVLALGIGPMAGETKMFPNRNRLYIGDYIWHFFLKEPKRSGSYSQIIYSVSSSSLFGVILWQYILSVIYVVVMCEQ